MVKGNLHHFVLLFFKAKCPEIRMSTGLEVPKLKRGHFKGHRLSKPPILGTPLMDRCCVALRCYDLAFFGDISCQPVCNWAPKGLDQAGRFTAWNPTKTLGGSLHRNSESQSFRNNVGMSEWCHVYMTQAQTYQLRLSHTPFTQCGLVWCKPHNGSGLCRFYSFTFQLYPTSFQTVPSTNDPFWELPWEWTIPTNRAHIPGLIFEVVSGWSLVTKSFHNMASAAGWRPRQEINQRVSWNGCGWGARCSGLRCAEKWFIWPRWIGIFRTWYPQTIPRWWLSGLSSPNHHRKATRSKFWQIWRNWVGWDKSKRLHINIVMMINHDYLWLTMIRNDQ